MMQRRVHKFNVGLGDYSAWEETEWDSTRMKRLPKENSLTQEINRKIRKSEKITAVVYHDGNWIVFTDDYGLGPPGP
jgi:hypothetical protein